MRKRQALFRWVTVPLLLCALLMGTLGGAGLAVRAAPEKQTSGGDVVISEFRVSGPSSGNDEFVEIYNRTNNPIPIGGWLLQKSSSSGSLSDNPRYTFPTGYTLLPGQHYLVLGSSFSGSVQGDATKDLGIADNGGIALISGSQIIDAVGMASGSAYLEEAPLAQFPGGSNQSYARKDNGCTDTDDNSADFVLQSPSDPQSSTSTPIKCLRVINVTSTTADGTYTFKKPPDPATIIEITVEFSSNVNVTGAPILWLETGSNDQKAAYASGSGSNILTFNYVVQDGDVSADLDYVDTNSLALNGGTITGAVGNADLTLPSPGAAGSLGANKNIVIDNDKQPSPVSFKRQVPLTSPTNADTLVFRVTFSEPVTGVDTSDFSVTGTTATVTKVDPAPNLPPLPPVYSSIYDITITGGDLAGLLNGDVGLNLIEVPYPDIVDTAGKSLSTITPTVNETYKLDNDQPGVTITQATGLPNPASVSATPVDFTVEFDEEINVSTFTAASITQNGTIPTSLITWSIKDSGNHKLFTLSATAIAANGTLNPSIDTGKVKDLAGNPNTASNLDSTVTFNDNDPPTVTINEAKGQADPATSLPIKFTVTFSEPIIASIFTPSDITQHKDGTATGITWSIADSGDPTTFTLSATAVSGYGTLIPTISANRVTDLVGNNNVGSKRADNKDDTVTYQAIKPTEPLTIVISEVAWAGTDASADDEWLELYNPGKEAVNLTGWMLKSTDLTPNMKDEFKNIVIKAGGYLLLERGDDDVITTIPTKFECPSIIYSGTLNNTGETLYLYDSRNVLVDKANSNGSYWPAGNAANYASMQRSVIKTDSDYTWVTYDASKDTNDKLAKDADGDPIKGTPCRGNLPFNVTPTPTPQRTATPTRSSSSSGNVQPILVISEFLPRQGHDWNNDGAADVFDEFIEVINAGTVNVNLNNYTLDDEGNRGSAPYPLPSLTLKPGERAVFYAADTGILLSDAGDTVRLLQSSKVVDAYTYDFARYPDQSLCRIPDSFGDWLNPCFPTPNNPNALTGALPRPPGPSAGYRAPACLLPDSAPDVFVYSECESTGGGIWNRLFWDGVGFFRWAMQYNNQKWETFFE